MRQFIYSFFFSMLFASVSGAELPQTEPVQVGRVMDGDTFRLSNGQKMRLAGINAPELHDTPKLPQEAKRFKKEVWAFRTLGAEAERIVQNFVRQTKNQMFVESDTQSMDEQENILGYVYLPVSQLDEGMTADGEVVTERNGQYHVFLNAYLLKIGLAELDLSSLDSKYNALFSKLESEAKQNKKGLWS